VWMQERRIECQPCPDSGLFFFFFVPRSW
jgi:hypothetical protein